MSSPGGAPPYYPPTQPPQAPPPPPPGYAYAPPGYAPPPGYVVAVPREKPKHVGLASGCTIAVGVLGLLAAMFMLLIGVFLAGLFGALSMGWFGAPMGAMMGMFALLPLVFGVLAIAAGVGLSRGTSWTLAVVVNVVSVVLSLPLLMGGGIGLLTGGLSGVALWALFQPDSRAFFAR